VIAEAGKMGTLHLHLTGGEPLARTDLEELVAAGRAVGLYTNLITSGLGLSRDRLQRIVAAGLDHIQISFQDSQAVRADWIAGTKSHAQKIELAAWVRMHKIAFTANLVVHRENLDHLEEMFGFLEQLQPHRIEIAHTQYYGWAFRNRDFLMPTPPQLHNALRIIESAQRRLKGRIRIESVLPDYYAQFPKACMGGWGRRMILINPSGKALPCHAAEVIPGLLFDTVRNNSLSWIWNESEVFQKFRGDSWMQEPCRNCERRNEDFGGCRCQAFLLTGEAAATDPVCSLSPRHKSVLQEIQRARGDNLESKGKSQSWTYRPTPSRAD
jgi:pyrroloquinoline quinone biosynthesis protein E